MDNFVDIILPGDENVTEATIMEWLKSPGDQVAEHEPLLEVSTDKVTIEIPSPASGILREVLSEADSVVYPGAILGRIETAVVVTNAAMEPAEPDDDFNEDAIVVADQGPRLSPLVRRMLREHGLSASDVRGSGRNGRITHRDILAHLDGHDNIIDDGVGDDSAGDDLIADDESNADDNLSVPLEDSSNEDGFGLSAALAEGAEIHGEGHGEEGGNEALYANVNPAHLDDRANRPPESTLDGSTHSVMEETDEGHDEFEFGSTNDLDSDLIDTAEFVLGEISEDELPVADMGVDWSESAEERTENKIDETSAGTDLADQEEGNLYGFLEANESESDLNQAAEFDSDMELVDISDCGPPSDADLLDGLGYDDDNGSAIPKNNATADALYDEGTAADPLIDYGASADPSFDSEEAQPFVFESEVSNKKPHSPMRRSIARHMVESVQTAPHVTAVFDADMSRVITHRELFRSEAERRGIRLTYTSYLVLAAARAIAEVPEINSVFHDDGLEIINHANIGVATALEDGLIVPVLHRADELDLLGIARRLQDMVSSARDGALSMADVSGGTFTITNHGVSGSLIATPIINQPQSAILGVGRLEKRVVVRQLEGRDSIQIVPMVYVTLTIDHRALDGYQANRFLSKFVDVLETWELSRI